MDIHATSRGRPGLRDSKIDLSLSQGIIYERNTAKRFMEDVRKVRSDLAMGINNTPQHLKVSNQQPQILTNDYIVANTHRAHELVLSNQPCWRRSGPRR